MKQIGCIAITLYVKSTWKNIPDPRLVILVDVLSQADEAEMGRKISVVIFVHGVHVSLGMRLKNRDNVHILRMLNRPKECAALLGIVMEQVKLGLKMKVWEVGVAEVKNVQKILPHRSRNLKSWVKPRNGQFYNRPEKSKPVPILSAGSGNSRGDPAEGR